MSVISIQASLVTFLGVGISILSNGVTQFISMFSVFLGFGKEIRRRAELLLDEGGGFEGEGGGDKRGPEGD